MRKKLFRFFAGIFVCSSTITVILIDQLKYVGVRLQYILIPTILISFILSYLFYEEDSGYLDFFDDD